MIRCRRLLVLELRGALGHARSRPAAGGQLALGAWLRRRRASAWWLAPLLPLYVAASLLLARGSRPVDDEGSLLAFARALLHGHYATVGSMNSEGYLWHGPALPLLLAPMVRIGLPLWAMRVLTGPLLLFVAVVLFERLLRLRLGRREALAGAFALGLFVPFGYLLRSIAKEELALVLVVAAMYGITRAVNGGPRRQMLLAGLALGALVYDRLEFGWVVLAMLLAAGLWTLLRRGRSAPRRFLAICAIALATCVPWLLYTHSVTGRVLYWGNSGGLSLYWMSSPSPDQLGAWHSVHTVFRDAYLAPLRPFFRRVDRLPPLARDLALQAAALRNIRADPAQYALNVAANASRMLFAEPLGVNLPAALVAAYGLCMALLLGTAARGAARLRRSIRPPPREALPFALLLVFGFGIHLFPTADPRMLMPLIPLLVWVAVQGWGQGRGAAHAADQPPLAPAAVAAVTTRR